MFFGVKAFSSLTILDLSLPFPVRYQEHKENTFIERTSYIEKKKKRQIIFTTYQILLCCINVFVIAYQITFNDLYCLLLILNKNKCWLKEDISQNFSENITISILICWCFFSDCIASQENGFFLKPFPQLKEVLIPTTEAMFL